MEESVMGQARDSWLKPECEGELIHFMGLTKRIYTQRGILSLEYTPEVTRILLNGAIEYLNSSGLSEPIKITTKARLNDIIQHSLDTEYGKTGVLRGLDEIYNELFVKAAEVVVECQCGKPSSTMSNDEEEEPEPLLPLPTDPEELAKRILAQKELDEIAERIKSSEK